MVNNTKQPLHARNSLKTRYFGRGLSKSLKNVNFIFLSNPVPFNGQSYQKQNGSGISDQSLFRLQNKSKKIPLLATSHLTKFNNVIWSRFWFIPKITSANLCKPIHDIIYYSTFTCPFVEESGKFRKEGKNSKKLNILRTKRAF